eukprot:g6209.t1
MCVNDLLWWGLVLMKGVSILLHVFDFIHAMSPPVAFDDAVGVAAKYVEALEGCYIERQECNGMSPAEARDILLEAKRGHSLEAYWQWLKKEAVSV